LEVLENTRKSSFDFREIFLEIRRKKVDKIRIAVLYYNLVRRGQKDEKNGCEGLKNVHFAGSAGYNTPAKKSLSARKGE